MDYTENIELLKPAASEQYNINHFNTNADTIDSHIHSLETNILTTQRELRAGDAKAKQFSNMEGVCAISQGGTGKTTAQEALNALHADVEEETSVNGTDEITFIKNTEADTSAGTEAKKEVKSVSFYTLANTIQELNTSDDAVFTSEKNGLVPKSGSSGGTTFLSADGSWKEPQGAVNVITVKTSGTEAIENDSVVRIQGTSTTVINEDNTKFMSKLTLFNETDLAQSVSLTLKEGNVVYKLNKRKMWSLLWNGTCWVPIVEELPVGTIQPMYTNTVPDGWFLCDGTDTSGTDDELQTCYVNLYTLLGNTNILPDLRESALVGVGENTRNSIATHDTYTLGQFKDDCLQTITGSLTNDVHPLGASFISASGAITLGSTYTAKAAAFGSGQANNRRRDSYFNSSRVTRGGNVTRGKRTGVNFIIKA